MHVAHLTRDLMFGSQVRGSAKSMSLDCKQVNSLAGLTSLMAEQSTGLVLLDLECMGVDTASLKEWLDQLEEAERPVLVAYAPHGHEQRLQDAKELPIDHVMTRGQFHSQVGRLLSDYKDR